MKKTINAIIGAALLFVGTLAAETIPPKPDHYFNDYANIVSAEKAHEFNEQLAQFERDTSNQFVVAVYPTMDTDSDPADYCQRITHSWQVGQADKRNGLVLFVFMKQPNGKGHIRFQTGYGLEGAMPDVTCLSITRQMGPYFRSKNYTGGLTLGINTAIKTINDAKDYVGTGKTKAETPDSSSSTLLFVIGIFVLVGIIIAVVCWATSDQTEDPIIEDYYSGSDSSYTPVIIPSYGDDDDSSSSLSSDDSHDSSPSSSFESGGGGFGGGGGGSDF